MRRKKSYGKKKKPANINKEIIRRYRKSNKGLRSVGLTCSKCKADIRINTNNPELYTEELKKNYVCLNCR